MSYVPFHDYFPEIAEVGTRSFTTFKNSELPADTYFLVEMYCADEDCDCRRVMFDVFSIKKKKSLAVIAWGWENRRFYENWFGGYDCPEAIDDMMGPILNLASPQSKYADSILESVKNYIITDKSYVERIKKHYRLFRDYIDSLTDRKADKTGDWDLKPNSTYIRLVIKIGRNQPCPCGSGKKYKYCCLDKVGVR